MCVVVAAYVVETDKSIARRLCAFAAFRGPEANVANGAPSNGGAHSAGKPANANALCDLSLTGYLRDQGRGSSAFWNIEYYQKVGRAILAIIELTSF